MAATDAALLRLRAETFHRLFPASKVPRLVVELAAQRLSKNSETPATLRNGAHTAEPRRAHPPLCVRRLKAGKGLFARSYPFVSVETPILGGLGCLAMIDAFYKKDNIRADDLTEQLQQGQPDSLITLSSKGSRKNNLSELALRFAKDWVAND